MLAQVRRAVPPRSSRRCRGCPCSALTRFNAACRFWRSTHLLHQVGRFPERSSPLAAVGASAARAALGASPLPSSGSSSCLDFWGMASPRLASRKGPALPAPVGCSGRRRSATASGWWGMGGFLGDLRRAQTRHGGPGGPYPRGRARKCRAGIGASAGHGPCDRDPSHAYCGASDRGGIEGIKAGLSL